MIDQKRMALVVDDEPDDLELVRHVLARAGYNVITAMDGKTAIERFRAHAEEIDILVTDVAMSPMTGCGSWPSGASEGIKVRPSRAGTPK